MKARVKATGEIVEVHTHDDADFQDRQGRFYWEQELYWTRLEHQAAIAALGGMFGDTSYDETTWEDMAEDAIRAAHTLVQKMKEERK